MDRIDHRIAVSEQARDSAARWLPGAYEIVPNGVLIPPHAIPANASTAIAFVGRHEPRKGLQVLLRAWPDIHRADRSAAAADRRRSARRRAAPAAARRPTEGIDILGFLSQDDLDPRAAVREGARRTVARRRELRDGADARVRVRAAGRRVRHPRLPRVTTRRDDAHVPPGDPAALTQALVAMLEDEPRRRGDGRGRACARGGGVRVGRNRAPPRPASTTSSPAKPESECARDPRPARRSVRVLIVLALLCVAIVMLYWRGPEWGLVANAFRRVEWTWIVVAIGLNLLSVVARSLAWRTVVPRRSRTTSAVRQPLLCVLDRPARRTRCCRRAHWRARARRGAHAPVPRGRGYTATLLGTVFTHRLFDVIPAMLLVVYVLLTAKIPHWALTSVAIAAAVGGILIVFALITSRLRKPVVDELSRLRRILAMARIGLDVLRSPAGVAVAIFFQCMGWLLQLFAVWASMRAFDIDLPLPAAGLVLVLMNIATIFPLWPGNIGLLQAAVALPLVSYGVPYTTGFAFGLGLQMVEMSVGVGVGLFFLAREGISFAMLKRMPDQTTEEPQLQVVQEDEPARARSA